MTPCKEISADVRKVVIRHRNENKSFGEIAKLLCLSKVTMRTILNNLKKSSSVKSKPRTGRPKQLDRRDVSLIRKEVDRNPKVHVTKLAHYIAERSKIVVHPRTVTRTLNNEGFHCITPRKNPLISYKNRKLRLEFEKSI